MILQGCSKRGFYGDKCDTPCPINCKNKTCHIQSGACYMCKPGWTGSLCKTSKYL